MIAAITQRIVRDHATGEIRDSLSHDWYKFLTVAGYNLVLPVPNVGVSAALWLEQVQPNMLILSGGNDVAYGQVSGNHYDSLTELRDSTEATLLKSAIIQSVPVIGVCRGMQFIHAFFGGSLHKIEGHTGVKHDIEFLPPNAEKKSWTEMHVNSYHNYCLDNKLSKELMPIAYNKDGTIEAIMHIKYQLYGIMWHPERNIIYNSIDIELFRRLGEGRGER
jgi:putative glutamine amidotransferase